MADNFNLRQFLTENKLTKNAKLLAEGKFSDSYKSQAAKDASYEIRNQIVNNLQSTKYEDLEGIVDKAIQATGEEVSPVEKAALLKHANWILTYNTGMEFEGVENLEKGVLDEAKQSPREKYLTRLVENALGLEGYGDDNVMAKLAKRDEKPVEKPAYTEGEEMVQEKALPEYKSIEELMKNIDHGTNEAACKYKMTEMKRIAQALEEKVNSLEEGEGAEFVDTKKVKQMKKDIMTLRKQADKLEKEYEKKFGEKKAKKEEK
jgi:hypothetical protein